MTGAGLKALHCYVPRGRVTAGAATGLSGVSGRPPARAVAAYDEDTVTMAVEAARPVVAGVPPRLLLVTSRPPYERKTTAAYVHAALRLDPLATSCADLTGGESAFATAVEQCATGGVVVLSDVVVGRPGSPQEAAGADAAVALRFAASDEPDVATVVAVRALPATDLLRWRLPGEVADRVWRGRYAAHALADAAARVAAHVLGDTGAPDVVAVASDDRRLAATIAKGVGGRAVVDVEPAAGHAGVAHAGFVLDAALRAAEPGERVLLLVAGDGASALLLVRGSAPLPPRAVAAPREVAYPEYLSWRGLLARDLSGRPEPAAPAAPAIARDADWKYGLVATRCTSCAQVQAPPGRVCPHCGSVDAGEPYPLADRTGRIATFTADHLVAGVARPVHSAVVDFDGGGRLECEVADVVPGELAVGAPVRMVFRRAFESDGIANYVWKCALVGEDPA